MHRRGGLGLAAGLQAGVGLRRQHEPGGDQAVQTMVIDPLQESGALAGGYRIEMGGTADKLRATWEALWFKPRDRRPDHLPADGGPLRVVVLSRGDHRGGAAGQHRRPPGPRGPQAESGRHSREPRSSSSRHPQPVPPGREA
ncbi:MAG: hypothetical protein ISS73_04270 [Pirellulales bacterium]|nr:hypothetical protein [Pirellulales bacterium]